MHTRWIGCGFSYLKDNLFLSGVQLDGIAKAFTHFSVAIRTHKPRSLTDQRSGFHQYRAVQLVESADDFTG